MDNVIAQVLGGEKRLLDGVTSVADVKAKMNAQGYTAAINGSPVDDQALLEAGDIVTLAKAVKGGA